MQDEPDAHGPLDRLGVAGSQAGAASSSRGQSSVPPQAKSSSGARTGVWVKLISRTGRSPTWRHRTHKKNKRDTNPYSSSRLTGMSAPAPAPAPAPARAPAPVLIAGPYKSSSESSASTSTAASSSEGGATKRGSSFGNRSDPHSRNVGSIFFAVGEAGSENLEHRDSITEERLKKNASLRQSNTL